MSDRMVTIQIDIAALEDQEGGDEIHVPLSDVIAELQAASLLIPEQHRDTAKLRINGHGDYVSIYANVAYERPETDDERRAREQKEQRSMTEREARERAELARLKAKYETPQ